MATRTNTINDVNINTAVGGTVNASDDVRITQDTAPRAYTAGLTAWAGVALATVFSAPPCSTDIGDETNALRLDCADVRLEHSHNFANVEGVSTKTIAKLILGSATGRASNFVSNATITDAYLTGGINRINATADVATARIFNCMATIAQGGAKGTLYRVGVGGRLSLGRDTADLRIAGGGFASLDHADAAVDAVTVESGGVLRCVKALPATLNLEAGATVDMSQADAVWAGGTINVEGPITVIAPRAGSLGAWYGAATVNWNAGEIVNAGSPVSGARI